MSRLRIAVCLISCLPIAVHMLAQPPQTATPVFTQPGGTYNTELTVGLSDATSEAVIYYTTNGAIPTSASTRYLGPRTLRENMTVTAVAYAPGHSRSNPVSETFAFVALPPVFNPPGGTYNQPTDIILTSGTSTADIFYIMGNGLPTASSKRYTGPIHLTVGTTITAIAAETGFTPSAPLSAKYLIGPSPTPQISPVGGTYLSNQMATISVSQPTARIFYTTDGTTPTGSSTPYTGPIAIGASETVKAVSVLPGFTPSTVASQAYVLPYLYPIVGYFRYFVKDPTGDSGDGGPAYAALMYEADDVAFDSAGNLYVVDSVAQVVRKISVETGIITTVAGHYVSNPFGGTPGYAGDGGPATDASFNSPTSVAFDSHDNMYIADLGNCVIRKVDAATGTITTVAGTDPSPDINAGYSGDGGPATNALLFEPQFIAIDSHDNLYIADTYNDVVRKVDANTGIITTIAGTGPTPDYKGAYTGDGGLATEAQLLAPPSIAFDKDDNLYIAGTIYVRKVSAATGIITTVAGGPNNPQGPYGTPAGDGGPATKAYLPTVSNVAFDLNGNLYITGTDLIRKVDATTGIISTVAGAYGYGYNGYYGPAIYADLEAPHATAFDSLGNLYFGQFNTVAKISLSALPGPAY